LLTVMALSFNKASAMIRIKESSLSLSDVEKGNESYRISKVQDKPTFSWARSATFPVWVQQLNQTVSPPWPWTFLVSAGLKKHGIYFT
jgi:hypothetical protein